jgi:hypothetical protein
MTGSVNGQVGNGLDSATAALQRTAVLSWVIVAQRIRKQQ